MVVPGAVASSSGAAQYAKIQKEPAQERVSIIRKLALVKSALASRMPAELLIDGMKIDRAHSTKKLHDGSLLLRSAVASVVASVVASRRIREILIYKTT
jgi:hypothetical protein